MVKTQRARLEMLLRVKDFGTANAALFPETSLGGQAFAAVAAAAARIESLAETRPVEAITARKAKAEARAAVTAAMREITRTGRGVHPAPGGTNALLMPARDSDASVFAAAHALIHNAEAVKDQLTQLGLPATCISDLRAAVDVFESTRHGRRRGRRGVASSESNMTAAFSAAAQALRTLDIVVPNAVKQDAGLLAGWKRDREVVGARKARATRKPVPAPAPVPAPTPVPDPIVTPVVDPTVAPTGETLQKAS
jgi:hypothetical protein